jgi:hypothetical protein
LKLKWQKIARQPVMNGSSPVDAAQVLALIAGDRDKREFLEDCIEWQTPLPGYELRAGLPNAQ